MFIQVSCSSRSTPSTRKYSQVIVVGRRFESHLRKPSYGRSNVLNSLQEEHVLLPWLAASRVSARNTACWATQILSKKNKIWRISWVSGGNDESIQDTLLDRQLLEGTTSFKTATCCHRFAKTTWFQSWCHGLNHHLWTISELLFLNKEYHHSNTQKHH